MIRGIEMNVSFVLFMNLISGLVYKLIKIDFFEYFNVNFMLV